MAIIFLFSKDNLKLARAEAEILLNQNSSADGSILISGKEDMKIEQLSKRLAYTKAILKELFASDYKNLEKDMEKFDWQNIYSESFSIRKMGYDKSKIKDEKEYAKFVWNKIKNPKVDLRNAKTKIIILCDKKVYVCLFYAETDKSYNKRKAHLRPCLHPTSLSPKLAKAMVNLTGAGKNDVILDPFCGSGGIIIEAGLMKMKTVGIDVSKIMLKRAEKNLEHYKVKNFKVIEGDSSKLKRMKADFVVTDLPYGKSSKITEKTEKLYLDFLENMKNWDVKKSVIGFPDFVDYKKIIKKAGLKIEQEFEQYIHKSLVKKIVVIK